MKVYNTSLVHCLKCDGVEFDFTKHKFAYTCRTCKTTILVMNHHVVDEEPPDKA